MSAPTVTARGTGSRHSNVTRSLVDVARGLGGAATYRQVTYWVATFPQLLLDHDQTQRVRPGSGYHFDLTAGEADRLQRMATLVLDGMTPAAAAYMARRGQRLDAAAELDVAWASGRGECS